MLRCDWLKLVGGVIRSLMSPKTVMTKVYFWCHRQTHQKLEDHVKYPFEKWTRYYCKRGYFRWGKISRKCWQDISPGGGGVFSWYYSYFFHKGTVYGFHFRVGVILVKTSKTRKTRKLSPRENYPHAKISTFTVLDGWLIFNHLLIYQNLIDNMVTYKINSVIPTLHKMSTSTCVSLGAET